MKVLHLLQSGRYSGAENVVCQIMELFRDGSAGVDMVYCSPDGPIHAAVEARGLPYFPLQKLSLGEARRAIRAQRPDVIHAHDMRAGFLAAAVCGDVPLISHMHNNNAAVRRLTPQAVAYRFPAARARHIFWVSDSARRDYYFRRAVAAKSSVLPNIVQIDTLYQTMAQDPAQYEFDVVYLGRLTYQKNPQRLMRVLKLAVDRAPGLKIAVVGTGDLEDETKSLCAELGLGGNVEFLGYRDNPLKLLHDAKVMLMTSRYEGTPMSALEAQALGVPVVSPPTDGLVDLIRDGVTGFLRDSDEELAEQTARLATDDALYRTMHEAARADARQRMDPEAYREKLLDVYRDCLKK